MKRADGQGEGGCDDPGARRNVLEGQARAWRDDHSGERRAAYITAMFEWAAERRRLLAFLCRGLDYDEVLSEFAVCLARIPDGGLPVWRDDVPVSAYLRRVWRRAIVNVLRRVARGSRIVSSEGALERVAEDALDAVEAAARRERDALLRLEVDRLPAKQRETVRLSLEGLEPKEIAALRGESGSAVRMNLKRARAALKDALEGVVDQ